VLCLSLGVCVCERDGMCNCYLYVKARQETRPSLSYLDK
jgi:hypothetical protein